jgi:sec-independent protein translocase protein TatC
MADEPFMNHLFELRTRIIKVVLSLLVAFGACIYFAKDLYLKLTEPLMAVLPEDSHFIATHPIEAWVTYLKVGLVAGIFLTSPVFFYQFWRFVSPGLKKKELNYLGVFVFFSSFFFIGGALFGYCIVFPLGFEYFVSILSGTDIHFLPQMKDAFAFIARMLFAFGIIFELPLVVFFLAASGIVSFARLMAFQKYLVVIALLAAAFLTPPDIITQVLMSLPMIILYQVGLLGAWLVRKKPSK